VFRTKSGLIPANSLAGVVTRDRSARRPCYRCARFQANLGSVIRVDDARDAYSWSIEPCALIRCALQMFIILSQDTNRKLYARCSSMWRNANNWKKELDPGFFRLSVRSATCWSNNTSYHQYEGWSKCHCTFEVLYMCLPAPVPLVDRCTHKG